MKKETLENITQRLDRLEKIVAEINQQLAWLVEKPVPDVPIGPEARAKMRATEALKSNKQDAHRTKEIMDKIFEEMGIPPDFDPGSIKDLRESMRQNGIRAEDNEFSRAIIEEREK